MQTETEQLIRRRRSVRAYLPNAVEKHVIESLLACARQAPSGANLQPGRFHVLTQQPLQSLSERLVAAAREKRPAVSEYSYFPDTLSTELKTRQQAAGYALYDALGIGRRDVAMRREQFNQNYCFFNAPVGIVVSIQKDMGKGCFMDAGMAIMNLLLSAEARGLGTTGIGALANYGDLVHDHLRLAENELVVCGIALGYPDKDHPINSVRTDREPLCEYAEFYGF